MTGIASENSYVVGAGPSIRYNSSSLSSSTSSSPSSRKPIEDDDEDDDEEYDEDNDEDEDEDDNEDDNEDEDENDDESDDEVWHDSTEHGRRDHCGTANPKMTRECVICGESRYERHFVPATLSCQHKIDYCSECLRTWVSSSLESNGWDSIRCPDTKCGAILTTENVQDVADRETFER